MLGDTTPAVLRLFGGKSMSIRILKEHLPWVAPTVAIVLAATGVIQLGPRDTDTTFDPNEMEVSRSITQNPVALGQQGAGLAARASGDVSAVQAAVIQSQRLPEAATTIAPAVVAPNPVAAPEVEPLPVSISPDPQSAPAADPGAFFKAAQAKLAQDTSCIDDLRVLADGARIYFPSSGLTTEDAGMAQARLIGLVAQDCHGVEIVITGHSDPSGDPAANLQLSQKRADEVLKRLSASGIETARFTAVGLGSQEPSGLTGSQPRGYYDRRVEFEIREASRQAAPAPTAKQPRTETVSACAAELQAAVAQTRLFYSPRSITAPSEGIPALIELAAQASSCPDARLRVIGQYSDEPGSGETPATARLRAVALMSYLVGSGFDSGEIIIAAHSTPQILPGQPGLSARRVDFDVILEN